MAVCERAGWCAIRWAVAVEGEAATTSDGETESGGGGAAGSVVAATRRRRLRRQLRRRWFWRRWFWRRRVPAASLGCRCRGRGDHWDMLGSGGDDGGDDGGGDGGGGVTTASAAASAAATDARLDGAVGSAPRGALRSSRGYASSCIALTAAWPPRTRRELVHSPATLPIHHRATASCTQGTERR